METCDHESCGREQYVWFPAGDSLHDEVRKHPWCKHCGMLKNISDDYPKKFGYWMNILSCIRHEFDLTKVQCRLIAVSLKEYTVFTDLYGITFSSQKKVFIKTVQQYSHCSEKDILDWLK